MTAEIRALRDYYRSDTDSLGDDFFKPCLAHAARYRRAAGYFSSTALTSWIGALPRALEARGLRIQLLVSPRLTPDDIAALSTEYSKARRIEYVSRIAEELVRELAELAEADNPPGALSRLFARLVVSGLVEFRIALPESLEGSDLFHEKFGIFDFSDGSSVAFSGSANETASGHYRNFESVDVFRSWVDADVRRVRTKSLQFDEAWENRTPGLSTFGLSDSALDLLRSASNRRVAVDTRTVAADGSEARWAHQDEAIAAFMASRVGILEMATGTGKTRTALRILTELVSGGSAVSAIIATEGTDLLDQWQSELGQWLVAWSIRWPIYRQYDANHEAGRYVLQPTRSILLVSRSQLPGVLRRLPQEVLRQTLIIHDEVHGFGVPSLRSSLGPEHSVIEWRLGLSATPERAYDEEGNAFVESELGSTIYQFPLEAAIDRGVLTGFDYIPLDYDLTEGDRKRLRDVFVRRAARAKVGRPMSKEEVWTELSRVHKTAEDKPRAFWEFLNRHPALLQRCIIFVDTTEYGNNLLDKIHSHTTSYRTYYADDDRGHLVAFARGDIEVLITCHRISQGIDIRSVESVVLFASARSKLETIQRIGRCLRVDPSNPTKRAKVVDFVRPQEGSSELENADQERRAWLSEIAKHPLETK